MSLRGGIVCRVFVYDIDGISQIARNAILSTQKGVVI
jgi:hypothetical protein